MSAINNEQIDFAIGGQAVIEGVMMRSPEYITVAVRSENGEIKTKEDPYKSITKRIKLLGLPFIRGVVGLVEMMMIGMKALNFSANVMMDEEEIDPSKKTFMQKALETGMMVFSFTLAIAMSLFLFKFLPLWITQWLSEIYPVIGKSFLYNLIDGLLKISFFILYIWVISITPTIKRVFEYHGAEHKSIFTYEKGLPLTVENAKKQSRFHPRCGTSFILIVFVISILVYTVLPRNPDFLMNFLTRVMWLPVIAGISYEFLKWSARHQDSKLMRVAIWPGLKMQLLTTKEPDDEQLEIGLKSLQIALDLESKKESNINGNIKEQII